MSAADPNLLLLESVAVALGSLCDRFVFVGGCATGLLLTDSASPPVRVTQDVDAIVEVLSLQEYHSLEHSLEERGFKHDQSPEAPVCRWTIGGTIIDVMPTDHNILGFGNRWYMEAVRTATHTRLPSGRAIKLIGPPAFIGTKLEAFDGRGRGDFLASHDLEDVTTVVDGRAELVGEVASAPPALRAYIVRRFGLFLENRDFVAALAGHLPGDAASQARLPIIVDRLRQIAALPHGN
jgi:hypothetical protein